MIKQETNLVDHIEGDSFKSEPISFAESDTQQKKIASYDPSLPLFQLISESGDKNLPLYHLQSAGSSDQYLLRDSVLINVGGQTKVLARRSLILCLSTENLMRRTIINVIE